MIGGKLIGTLSFGTRSRPRFSDDDVAMMKTAADQVAIAMHRLQTQRATQAALEALRESEERYRSLVEMSPECIAVHRGGELLYINPAGARLLGLAKPEEAVGRSVYDLLPPERRQQARAVVQTVKAQAASTPPMEEEFVRFDVSTFIGEARATAVMYGGGRAVQIFIRDISEQKRAAAAVQKARDELEERVQERTAELSLFNT
jgi:PAS domain S-box-containing protein